MQNLHTDEVATPIGVAGDSPDHLQLALTNIAEAARSGSDRANDR